MKSLEIQRTKPYLLSTGVYEVPSDWFKNTLEEVIEDLQTGFASGERDPNGVIQLRMNNITLDGHLDLSNLLMVPRPPDIARYDIKRDDILFNNTNSLDLIGKTAIVKKDLEFTFSNHITRIRVKKEKIVPYWLYLTLLRFRERSVFKSVCNTFVGQSGIGREVLKQLPVFMPSINEQRQIALILSKVDDIIQKTEEIIEQARKLKKGLMDTLLTRGIDNTTFRKERLAVGFFAKEISSGWKVTRMEQLCDVVRGQMPRPAGNPKYYGGKIPWITVGEITKDDFMYLDSCEFGLTEEGKKESRFIEAGTIVIANSGATLGVPKILNISGCINDGVVALLNMSHDIDPIFLYYMLYSWISLLRNINQGMGQPNLNTRIISNLLLPLPPIEEQKKIVAILAMIDANIQNQNNCYSITVQLKKALMQKLLTGKIRAKP